MTKITAKGALQQPETNSHRTEQCWEMYKVVPVKDQICTISIVLEMKNFVHDLTLRILISYTLSYHHHFRANLK